MKKLILLSLVLLSCKKEVKPTQPIIEYNCYCFQNELVYQGGTWNPIISNDTLPSAYNCDSAKTWYSLDSLHFYSIDCFVY